MLSVVYPLSTIAIQPRQTSAIISRITSACSYLFHIFFAFYSNWSAYRLSKYNAVLKNARDLDSDVYGPLWKGPPPSAFSGEAQTNALSVLIAAITLRNDTLPGNDTLPDGGPIDPDGPPKSDDPPIPEEPPNVGAIVGGVIGGLALVTIIVTVSLMWRRRQLERRYAINDLDHSRAQERQEMDHTHQNASFPGVTIQDPQDFGGGRYREKGLGRLAAPETSTFLGPGRSETSGTQGPANSNSVYGGSSVLPWDYRSSVGASTFGSVPTADLVRPLNGRLQPVRWREDEAPPDYASQHG
ncbi:hypothetical protein MPER_00934 [Moniliophthora perniciosa FA553]|nr:hypothetical protein MPER_00934 [Moniliophthora perniciosa FA553]